MIADVIILAIFILFVFIGIKRGIAVSALNLVALVVTAIAAFYLSGLVAKIIYDANIKQTVLNNLEQTISKSGVDQAFNNCFSALPEWLYNPLNSVMGALGLTAADLITKTTINNSSVSSAASSIEQAISPVIIGIFSFLLVIIFFILILFILKRLIKLLLPIFKVPVVKQINNFLGGVLGAGEGVVFSWIAVNVFYGIMYISQNAIIHSNMVTGFIFKWLCVAM